MTLSVIIPVYNEKETIRDVITHVQETPFEKEIIIVDDGSTDGTRELLESGISDLGDNIHVFFHSRNQGKGAAIRTGLKTASNDIVIIQDADLEYDPKEYAALVEPIVSGKADVVYGSRFTKVNKWLFIWHWIKYSLSDKPYEIKYVFNFLGIQLLNLLANILYGAGITDEATCYKVFKRDVLQKIDLKCQRFEFCPEVTAKVRKLGYTIYEVPISYTPRSKLEGKKLTLKDGFAAVFTLIKYRFRD